MGTIVSNVIDALQAANIRSDEAYPGGRIPALTGPVAAVRLGKVDRSVRATSVQVIVMSPAALGGSVCESTALRAIEALEAMDGVCVKGLCQFDDMADVFYIEITAEFFGVAKDGGWDPGPGYAVKIGEQRMEWVTGFTIRRQTDDEITAIADAQWEFNMEELLGPGSVDPPDPTEPFTMVVTRNSSRETFTGCTWTSVKRTDTLRGISQIRTGVARKRTNAGAL